MKDISIYFRPLEERGAFEEQSLGSRFQKHSEKGFPELSTGIAIFSCPEFRRSEFHVSKDEGHWRKRLYELKFGGDWSFSCFDLGEVIPGDTIENTYFAISQIITELVKNQIVPVLIGGSQDLTYAMYQGYQQLEQLLNLTVIDKSFDLGEPDEEVKADAFISKILMSRPCYLFNCANIGVQQPYVRKDDIDLFEKLFFDVCRLGEFNADFKRAEPLLRNTDLMSIDMDAVRRSDYQGLSNTPNGFYADQICQIMKYAGISDKLSSIGFFNVAHRAEAGVEDALLAEMLWYFMDGYAQRKGDFPVGSKKDYQRFIVHLEGQEEDLVFYKSPRSDRWWMEVPYPPVKGNQYERQHIVPCNQEDYEQAMKNEMPDLWWKTYQKLH
ncbi:MAG: arginase [Bacteroidetes bacterium]|nr:MAG: arginase [Bacteroidota bacterium]